MTLITTSSVNTATAQGNQRKIAITSNGVMWACYWNGDFGQHGSSNPLRLAYSTDNGLTWTDNTSNGVGFSNVNTSYIPNASFFIDQDDYAHIVYKDRSDGFIYYRRGTPNTGRTAWTWSSATAVLNHTIEADYPDVIAHREGTGWVAHIANSIKNASLAASYCRYTRITITAANSISAAAAQNDIGVSSTTGGLHTWPSIDFNHIGDGKTVKGKTLFDDFNRANAALSATPTQTPLLVWNGSMGISSNRAYFGAGSVGTKAVAIIGSPNMSVKTKFATVEQGAACIGRYVDSNNFWEVIAVPGFSTWNVNKIVGGVSTNLGNTGLSDTNPNAVVEFVANGNSIQVWVNGVLGFSTTDSTHNTAIRGGFGWGKDYTSTATVFYDEWTGSTTDPVPDVFVGWSGANTTVGMQWRRGDYTSGSWTWDTTRTVITGLYVPNTAGYTNSTVWTGNEFIIGGLWVNGSSLSETRVYSINPYSSVATVQLVATTAVPTNYISDGQLTSNGTNWYLIGRAGTNPNNLKYYSSGPTSGSTTLSVPSAGTYSYFSTSKIVFNNAINFVYTSGTTSPFSVTYDKVSFFTAATIKVWNGTAWVAKKLKRWTGSEWAEVEKSKLKRWNGTTWVQASN